MGLISLLHPSRQRSAKSWRITREWIAKAGAPVELIVSIDDNDPERGDYLRLYSQADPFTTRIISNQNRSAVDAINNAAREAKGDIFIVLSDDTECPQDWANKINQATIGLNDFVIKVNDGIQKWIVTMPVIDRAYYNRFGYVYHPDYRHMFCDTEFTHVADLLKKIVKREDIHFPHNHYSIRKSAKDDVNERNDSTWNQGKELYLSRIKQGFGMNFTNLLDISHPPHVNWIRSNVNI